MQDEVSRLLGVWIMVRITIDKEMQEKILDSDGLVELCDESGRLLGQFFPHKKNPLEGWEPITPEPSEEELEESRKYDGPGMTTSELIDHLRNRS